MFEVLDRQALLTTTLRLESLEAEPRFCDCRSYGTKGAGLSEVGCGGTA